jgi:hypothetical protein
MMHEADLEQQRQARRKIVTSNETLKELSAIVRADLMRCRSSVTVTSCEQSRMAGKIEVMQSVDVNFNLEMRASVHAIAQEQNISERDAAVKLADQLADEPELAAMFREWAVY